MSERNFGLPEFGTQKIEQNKAIDLRLTEGGFNAISVGVKNHYDSRMGEVASRIMNQL